MTRRLFCFFVLSLFVVAMIGCGGGTVGSQTGTTRSLQGVLADSNGDALAGVTIRASNADNSETAVDTTDETGFFLIEGASFSGANLTRADLAVSGAGIDDSVSINDLALKTATVRVILSVDNAKKVSVVTVMEEDQNGQDSSAGSDGASDDPAVGDNGAGSAGDGSDGGSSGGDGSVNPTPVPPTPTPPLAITPINPTPTPTPPGSPSYEPPATPTPTPEPNGSIEGGAEHDPDISRPSQTPSPTVTPSFG